MSGSNRLGIKRAIASLFAAGALCTGSFAQHENCPNLNGGNCFEATPGIPGCQDEDCCIMVCDRDPNCCASEWDEICVDFAQAVNCRTILHVPGDFPTIQEAIDMAMNGDEVVVAPGTYNETINFLGKAIWLHSSDGPEVTIIDAQQTGTVVTCDSREGRETVLDGFTVTGGSLGGMFNLFFTSPTVTNCTFTKNSAPGGGGMFNILSSPTVTNCMFSENSAKDGGAMFNTEGSNPAVTGCTFEGNTAAGIAGGMYNHNCSSPTVTDCTFSGNSATFDGGGMYNEYFSSPSVMNCIFSGNTARGKFGGGGMFNDDFSRPPISESVFCGNDPDHINGPWIDEGGNEFLDECSCTWDLDGSGSVGLSDLLSLLAAWGPNPGHPADFDGDDTVGLSDLLVMLANWGPCP